MIEQQSAQLMAVSAYGRRFVSKVIAGFMCSGGLSWLVYQLMLRDAAGGQAAYVADQAAYFQESLSPPSVAVVVLYVVMICFFLFLYEVISLAIYLLIRERRR